MSLSNFVSNFNRIYGPFKEWYSKINPANMTGAIDVIVVQQQDGTYLSSPFHVRFGKYGVLKAKEKIVDIEVNEVPVTIHMKLDDNGAAYFVEMVDSDEELEEIHPDLATSPIPQDSWLLMETNTRKKRTNSCSSSSSSSSLKSISRRRLELIPVPSKKSPESTIAIQTDMIGDETEQEDTFVSPQQQQQALESLTSDTPTTTGISSTKGKLNRKKRRRREYISKHSRNNSKTSLKDMVHSDGIDDDASGDDETENDDSIFVMEDEKEDLSDRTTFVSVDSRKNSAGSYRNNDEMDRAAVCAGQTPDGVSFLLSRLPDQEKLDSILEHQAELEKKDLSQQSVRSKLTVDIAANTHYFSEPDLSPVTSPVGSRPPSPVLSDSELEVAQRVTVTAGANKQEEQSWEWGKLPTTSTLKDVKEPLEKAGPSDENLRPEASTGSKEGDKPGANNNAEGTAGWGLSYLWRGRSKSEKQSGTNQDEQHGIYLDDLKDDDAEMLEIYVGRGRNVPGGAGTTTRSVSGSSGAPVPVPNVVIVDDDAESGNGPSLPMSPHSVEGAIGGPLYDRSFRNLLPDVDVSLCGGLEGDHPTFSTVLFEQSKVTFDDFVLHLQNAEPTIFNSPDLVVRIGEQYYKWSAACPIIMSTILYGRTLPSDLVEVIRGSFQEPKPQFDEKMSTLLQTDVASSTGVAQKKHSTSWWPFSSKKEEEEKRESSVEKRETVEKKDVSLPIETSQEPISVAPVPAEPSVPEIVLPAVPLVVEPEPAPKMTTRYSIGTQTEFLDDKALTLERDETEPEPKTGKERFRKTLRLSNDAINCLNLVPGMNEVQFSVTTAYQGTTRCSCHLYLWKWSDKIVISDIDGTITKSDVLGHVLPVIGRDWAQSGVAELFTKIKNNGYHIAYLSARAIGQASFTKDYLASIRQGDVNLPDGPLLLNPTSLMNALHREVIEKKPEKFKIACLNDIKTLFPEGNNPLFAGYGNRANDVIAYTAVGIPVSRIFTINYKGELRHEFSETFQTSYSSQSSIVDHIFPPLNSTSIRLKTDCSPTAQLEYSNFAYWRDPLPELEDDLENQNCLDVSLSNPNRKLSTREDRRSSSPSSPTKEIPYPINK